jgi:4-hydroxybenzoate polyprenyltransferase
MIRNYTLLLRPKNWIKNILIALPMLLAGHFDFQTLVHVIFGFISFSCIASGTYIINDIVDIEHDRAHVKKRYRPLAEGVVRVDYAILLSITLIAVSLICQLIIGIEPYLIVGVYFILNLYYSFSGKTKRFIDILILSTFYLIRVYYGAAITNVSLTGWFIATISLAVLSLAVNKRFMECSLSKSQNILGRSYTKADTSFLQVIMFNFAIGSIVFLNLHAFLVLLIVSPYFYFALNIVSASILFFYFDYASNASDDPVDRVLKNYKLLFSVVIFCSLYFYEFLNRN